MSTDTLKPRSGALALHDGDDAAEPTRTLGTRHTKLLPERGSPVHDNPFRSRSIAPAAAAFASAIDDKHGVIARRLGVKHPTVTKWTQGELPITLRDIIACGPEVMRSVASSLKTLAAAEQANTKQARTDLDRLVREMLRLSAVVAAVHRRAAESGDPESPAGRGVSQGEKDGVIEALESLKDAVEQLLENARQLPVEH